MPQEEETGLFLPATSTLYLIARTKWTNKQMSIDRIRKILLARGLLNFTGASLSGSQKDIGLYLPQMMTLKEAETKNFKIEYLYGSETEKTRVENQPAQPSQTSKPVGIFKKKDQK